MDEWERYTGLEHTPGLGMSRKQKALALCDGLIDHPADFSSADEFQLNAWTDQRLMGFIRPVDLVERYYTASFDHCRPLIDSIKETFQLRSKARDMWRVDYVESGVFADAHTPALATVKAFWKMQPD